MAPGNLIASAATRIALPRVRRDANEPQARPICPISHPPNTPPYGFVSAGMAVTRMMGVRSGIKVFARIIMECSKADRSLCRKFFSKLLKLIVVPVDRDGIEHPNVIQLDKKQS